MAQSIVEGMSPEIGASEMEIAALAFIADQDEPVGSPRLREALADRGIIVGEATVGRFLRSLDRSGYTESIKTTRGRVITPLGLDRLAALLRERRRASLSAELHQALGNDAVTALLDLLYARRGVEAEATRLATRHAPDDAIAEVTDLAREHVRCVGGGDDTVSAARNFHLELASLSGNAVITALASFLLDAGNDPLVQLLDQITFEAGEALHFAQDHARIAGHMLIRDEDAAERAMREHIDEMIAAVEAYLEKQQAVAPAR